MGQTDRRTDGRQTVTLRFPLDAASVIYAVDAFRMALQVYNGRLLLQAGVLVWRVDRGDGILSVSQSPVV